MKFRWKWVYYSNHIKKLNKKYFSLENRLCEAWAPRKRQFSTRFARSLWRVVVRNHKRVCALKKENGREGVRLVDARPLCVCTAQRERKSLFNWINKNWIIKQLKLISKRTKCQYVKWAEERERERGRPDTIWAVFPSEMKSEMQRS